MELQIQVGLWWGRPVRRCRFERVALPSPSPAAPAAESAREMGMRWHTHAAAGPRKCHVLLPAASLSAVVLHEDEARRADPG